MQLSFKKGTQRNQIADSSSYQRLKIFYNIQLIILHYTGIFPNPKVNQNEIRRKCYNVCTGFVIILSLTSPVAMCTLIYQNWGLLAIVTGVVFQTSFYTVNTSVYAYMTLNRQRLWNAISSSEVHSGMWSLFPKGVDIYTTVMKEAFHSNKVLTWSILIANASAYFSWIILPMALWFMQGEETADSEDTGYNTGKWRYFIYMMWVPENAVEYPTYCYVYLYQTYICSMLLIVYTAYNIMFSSLIIDIISKFDALMMLLKNIDNMNLHNDENLAPKRHRNGDDNNGMVTIDEHQENRVDENAENDVFNNENEFKILFRGVNVEEQSELAFEDFATGLNIDTDINIRKEEQFYYYLVNCIKYHQHILRQAELMNEMYSPILFIVFTLGLIMMCTSVFQITLGTVQETSLKISSAMLATWFPIALICYFGEKLTQQSMKVQEVAWSTKWYDRSPQYRKLFHILIMRTQKPVQLTGGKFFVASLETLSELLNKVYAYYTVLKQMQDSE